MDARLENSGSSTSLASDSAVAMATGTPLSDAKVRHSASVPNLPLLDTTDASIVKPDPEEASSRDAPSIELPHQHAEEVGHIALDIGGSLIKLVYFSSVESSTESMPLGLGTPNQPHTGGKLHFVKFETSKLEQAVEFITAKGLHKVPGSAAQLVRVKATGGGAYKFTEVMQERLGVVLEKEDEMDCLVAGCNFLLRAIRYEAFAFEDNQPRFIPTQGAEPEPYLLVNIGSGVSMLKVAGDGGFERVSGSSMGGGTFWGLCRLLTRCSSFDEMLALSSRGDSSKVDMLVGDIYGDRDYSAIGLSASTIASSFGKVVSSEGSLEDYNPADIALALCRMVSYNIGHLAYLNAMRYNLRRVIFGGFFIRGHSYTMATLSFAIHFWSKGDMAALFLRHEGYLGALGCFLKAHPLETPATSEQGDGPKLRGSFVERFSMGAPFLGGQVQGPPFQDVHQKVDWVERFVQLGTAASKAAQDHELRLQEASPDPESPPEEPQSPLADPGHLRDVRPKMALHVGVLHYNPGLEPFPLLADPLEYKPNTHDIVTDGGERAYWLGVLQDAIPVSVDKACLSEDRSPDAQRRSAAFGRAFQAHLTKLMAEPGVYGDLGLYEMFEMREECLREFGFADAYRQDKARENAIALEVLPDLLTELDAQDRGARLTSVLEGVLASNIFDWGARDTVKLYRDGTILEIYREARNKLAKRPWRVDHYEAFAGAWLGSQQPPGNHRTFQGGFRRALMFIDNAGADAVLGMIPLARELLRGTCEVIMVANARPAINDVTVWELQALLHSASAHCSLLKEARGNAVEAMQRNGGRIPDAQQPSHDASSPRWQPRLYVASNGQGCPCLDLYRLPRTLCQAAQTADLIILEGMGRSILTNYQARFSVAALKVAMIKNARLAQQLFDGQVYDCVCIFEPAPAVSTGSD